MIFDYILVMTKSAWFFWFVCFTFFFLKVYWVFTEKMPKNQMKKKIGKEKDFENYSLVILMSL